MGVIKTREEIELSEKMSETTEILTEEQLHEQDLQRIKDFKLMDDGFLNACFADNIPATELILRIILGKKDLIVNSVETQKTLKNLFGRSLRLDIKATDLMKKVYNVEVQRDDTGADPKRARYHGSLMDANIVEPGEKFQNIPETYVIFITERDYFEQRKPIYEADRYYRGKRNKLIPLNDGLHIVYVNGAYKGKSDIGKLAHDFRCTEPDDMYFKELAERARYFKKDEGGVKEMCKMLEDMRTDNSKQIALRMIADGKLSIEKIAEYTSLPVEVVKELAEKRIA